MRASEPREDRSHLRRVRTLNQRSRVCLPVPGARRPQRLRDLALTLDLRSVLAPHARVLSRGVQVAVVRALRDPDTLGPQLARELVHEVRALFCRALPVVLADLLDAGALGAADVAFPVELSLLAVRRRRHRA